jgi:hypothetical protein
MKTITRSNIYVPMAAMILTAAFAVTAAAQKQVPFKGVIQGQDKDIGGPDTAFLVTTTGTGIGTHVGQFSFTLENTVNFVTGTDTGSARLIAANGDSIYATFAGSGEPTATPNVVSITEIYTITGGTGRFAGAHGSLEVEIFHKLGQSGAAGGFETHDASGSVEGTITLPGTAH